MNPVARAAASRVEKGVTGREKTFQQNREFGPGAFKPYSGSPYKPHTQPRPLPNSSGRPHPYPIPLTQPRTGFEKGVRRA